MKLTELGFGWDLVTSPYELTSRGAGSSQTTRFRRKPKFHSLKRYRPKLGAEPIERTDQQGKDAPLSDNPPRAPLASTGNQSRRRA